MKFFVAGATGALGKAAPARPRVATASEATHQRHDASWNSRRLAFVDDGHGWA